MQVANVNVPIKVTGRHLSVTDAIRDYAHTKIEHIHLDYPRIMEAHVILDVQKHRHQAEIVLHCSNHITIEATEESDDMYASIDGVVAKVARQMRKYKTRLLRSHRPKGDDIKHLEAKVLHIDDSFHLHEEEPKHVHTEKYVVRPMYTDEAIVQLEMSEGQFVVFTHAATQRLTILYRRKDGFGVIEPTFA